MHVIRAAPPVTKSMAAPEGEVVVRCHHERPMRQLCILASDDVTCIAAKPAHLLSGHRICQACGLLLQPLPSSLKVVGDCGVIRLRRACREVICHGDVNLPWRAGEGEVRAAPPCSARSASAQQYLFTAAPNMHQQNADPGAAALTMVMLSSITMLQILLLALRASSTPSSRIEQSSS